MSFYEPQGWQAPVRQPSWEQPPPPSRSGASSTSQRDESNAFTTQFDEVDKAIDNLVKSGKFYPSGPRRDPAPMMYGAHGQRGHSGRHSVSSAASNPRSHANPQKQNFYAAQRFQSRPSETDQMMQAKRRMAAQRERELRNYHQEQQYNRSLLAEMASNKSDRSMSPSTLSEEGRRDLIARQHRALYGGESSGYSPTGGSTSEQSANAPASGPGAIRGSSPRGVDPFGMPTQGDGISQGLGDAKATSPSGAQGGKVATPPNGEDGSHSRSISKSTTAPISGTMGPIGSRPNTQHAPAQSLNKRTTSPLPSSLGFGFPSNEQSNDRTGSSNAAANQQKDNNAPGLGAWGTGSGVWGSNKIGTSVWS